MGPHDRDALLEREVEVSTLGRLIAAATKGKGRFVLLEGAAGIGTTRLLEEAGQLAEAAGFRRLDARSSEIEREFPFGVVRQLFEASVLADNAVLSGPTDAIKAVFEAITPNTVSPSASPSFAILHGLYRLTMNISAATPLLISVDDLQWCDSASLRFLSYVARRLEGLPVLIVCAARPLKTHTDVALVGELAADPRTVTVQPRPLSASAVGRLIRAHLGIEPAPEFTSVCLTATGGNPFFTHELLLALGTEGVRPSAANVGAIRDLGPRAISRTVFLRLTKVPQEAVQVANALAILTDGAGPDLLALMTDLPESQVGECLSLLIQADIVRPDMPTSFVHPLIASAIRDDIPVAQRAAMHERAAAILSVRAVPAEQVAVHLLEAIGRHQQWVVDMLRRAARGALVKGAPDNAVAYLARALEEPPVEDERPEILLELGRAEALISGPHAVEHLKEAYGLLSDPFKRALCAEPLARALLLIGYPQDAAAVAREAAEGLPPEHADMRSALEAFRYLAVMFGAGDSISLSDLTRYRTLDIGSAVGEKMLAAIAARVWIYECGPRQDCSELSLAALAGGDLIAADNGMLATVAISNLVFADRPEATYWWEVARADAHRRGSQFAIAALNLWHGHALYYQGELAGAEDSLRRALDQFGLWGYGQEEARVYYDAFLSAVQRERGLLSDARATLTHSVDPGGTDGGSRYRLNSQVELLLAEQRYSEAHGAVLDYERRFADLVRNPMDAPWRSHKATVLHALGHHAQAAELVEEELELARQWGGPSTIARSLRTMARIQPSRQLDLLTEALEVLDRCPAQLELAKTLVMRGSALRRARLVSEAREQLRAGLELSQACRADALTVHARTELYAAGGRPRSVISGGVDSLSASERRVAELAAEGRHNRDIARELFVTPKTVEAHLSSVYRKLGIRSRHELPAIIGTQRLELTSDTGLPITQQAT